MGEQETIEKFKKGKSWEEVPKEVVIPLSTGYRHTSQGDTMLIYLPLLKFFPASLGHQQALHPIPPFLLE